MMKFAFALVAVLAVVSPMQAYTVPRTGSGALADEVQDFVDLVPIDKTVQIVLRYATTDSEVQALLAYMQSSTFKQLVTEIEDFPEIKNILNYIQKAGLDAYYLVNKINSFLGLKQLTPANAQMVRATAGIRGMLDEIEALIPMQKVKELYEHKLATSKVWADFVAQLKSPAFQNVADKLCTNATFKDLLHKANDAHVKIDSLVMIIERVLGLKLNCRP